MLALPSWPCLLKTHEITWASLNQPWLQKQPRLKSESAAAVPSSTASRRQHA
jgi:hypothetical protein